MFITRLSSGSASQLLFTRLITTDSAFSGTPPELKLLSDGAIAVIGVTQDSFFPLVQPLSWQSPAPGYALPFLTVFSPSGSTLRLSTTLAGPSGDPHLAIRGYDEVYVGLRTTFGGQSTPGAFQTQVAGGADLLLIKVTGVAPPNTKPIVTSPIRVSGYFSNIVNATSLAGASVPLTALVRDPDGDPLTVTLAGPLHDDAIATLVPSFNGQFQADAMLGFPLGTSLVTMTVSDGRGGIVTTTAQITVLGTATNATSGTVTVSPVPMLDRTFAFSRSELPTPVENHSGNITGTGVTTVNVRTNGVPPLPDGYQLGSPPYYYDVVSTVPAAGPFTFCVDVEGMSFADSNLRMFVHDGVAWTDVTTAAGAHEVCGQSAALGTYAILHRANVANTATTIAGSGYDPGALDGPGGDPRDDFIDGQLPTLTALSLGRGGVAVDRARNLLYTTTLTRIRRVDLSPDGILDTIAGDGIAGEYAVDPDDGTFGMLPTNNVDARSTHITDPRQLALDSQGNLYIAEICQIRRIDTSNVITTVAGDGFCRDRGDGGPATAASIDVSPGVAIDRNGNIIILEQAGRIRRVANGVIDTVGFVPQDWLDRGFNPVRIAVAANGDFYIVGGMELLGRMAAADGQFSVINRCALTTCPASRFGGDGRAVSEARFQRLLSVAVDVNGVLLVGDSFDHRIRRIAAGADGVVTGETTDEIVRTVTGYNHAGTPGSFHAYLAQENYGLSSAVSTPWDVIFDPNGGFFFERVHRSGMPESGLRPRGRVGRFCRYDYRTGPRGHHSRGLPLTYDVVMSNLGPSPTATIARLRATLPDGMEFGSGSLGGGRALSNAGSVVCDVDGLAAGANAQGNIVVTPKALGSFSLTFEVSSSMEDPDRTNNSATVTVTSALVVDEQIHINDSVAPPQPAAMIPVSEVVHVSDDVPAPQPAITIPIVEVVQVSDEGRPLRSLPSHCRFRKQSMRATLQALPTRRHL